MKRATTRRPPANPSPGTKLTWPAAEPPPRRQDTVQMQIDATPYPCIIKIDANPGDAILVWQGVVIGVHKVEKN